MSKAEQTLRTIAVQLCGVIYLPVKALISFGKYLYKKQRARTDMRRMLRSIEWAKKLSAATGYRYIVLRIGGKYVVKPKSAWQKLLKRKGKVFAKGTTIQDLENKAIYITP